MISSTHSAPPAKTVKASMNARGERGGGEVVMIHLRKKMSYRRRRKEMSYKRTNYKRMNYKKMNYKRINYKRINYKRMGYGRI